MEKTVEVELTEQEVETAIKEYVYKHQKLTVKSIRMRTSVKGDYDKGDAVEYVKKVWCQCE